MTRRPLSDEGRLLVLLTLLDPTSGERAEIARLFAAPIDYAYFDRLARANVHRTWILTQIETLGHLDRLPEPYRSEWTDERAEVRKKLERRFEHARPLFRSFREAGIPVVLLKGTGLAHQIYRNPFYKKSNDIDILIQKPDLPKIYDLYESLGFVSFGERVKDDKATQEKVAWHATPYVSRDLSLVIGTQWGIKTLLGPYRVDYDAIWSRVEDLDFQGVPVKILAPEDTLLHLCLHLGFFKTQLKDLIDVTNLLRFHRARFPFERFVDAAIGAGAASHAYQALYLSNRLCPMTEIDSMLVRLRPHVWGHYLRGVAKKTESLDDFLQMSVDWIQEVEIDMTLFLGAEGLAKKGWAFLRVWGTILIPPRAAMLRMNFVIRAGFFEGLAYRVLTPFRIVRALAEEISWKLVALLSVKTVIDFAVAFVHVFDRRRKSTSPYATLAAKLGKTEAEIERFTKEFC